MGCWECCRALGRWSRDPGIDILQRRPTSGWNRSERARMKRSKPLQSRLTGQPETGGMRVGCCLKSSNPPKDVLGSRVPVQRDLYGEKDIAIWVYDEACL